VQIADHEHKAIQASSRMARRGQKRKQQEASPPPVAAAKPIAVTNPNAEAAQRRSTEHIAALRQVGRRENTKRVHDPKLQEYREYYLYEHQHDDAPYTVTRLKVWWFMLYQAMRKPKQRGGKKKAPPPKFNTKEYDEIIGPFKSSASPVMYVTPKDPVGYECVNQYRKVIKKLHQKQQADGINSTGWEFIWTEDCKELIQHVKERKPQLDKENYIEKQSQEFAPYIIVSRFGDIEQLFWLDAARSPSARSLCSRLRYRCCFLQLTSAVLRSESLHRAEISDFFGLVPPMKSHDVHPMYLQIHQIPIGKTTYGSVQYGRAGRHIDPRRCSIGATALYLECREGISKEFTVMTKENWLDNSHWFDIKFLADANGNSREEMKSDTYGDKVKEHLRALGLPMNKVLHLGRNLGTKYLDIMEVDVNEVKRMGQWNQSIYEKAYSSKLPMTAIRQLAGFEEASGMHFNTRTQVFPSDELQQMTKLGILSHQMAAQFSGEEASKHPTAWGVINWMKDLSVIFLQDVAAMIVQFPEDREMAALEREFTVLRSQEFKVQQFCLVDYCCC
jgi:Centromere DNA-binding protein complex CBF3 subunit, domain 2